MITEELLIDNEHVKVLRVTVPPGETHPAAPRGKRVVVAVTPHLTHRRVKTAESEETIVETIHRDIGDAVFREASNHAITNLSEQPQTSVIIELKEIIHE